MLAEELLELALAQAHRGRERAVDPPEVEARDLAAAREKRHAGDGKGGREHLVRDPRVVPQLEAACLEIGGPRDGRTLRGGVDNAVLDAELAGEAEPDGTGAGDQHPDLHPPSVPPVHHGRSPRKRRRSVAVIWVCPSVPFPR
ncbi:MAG TPA: hypothetical protein VI122_14155 [Thermoleophilaceae bacterium]